MTNILENYTNEQRKDFIIDAQKNNKRIEKQGNKLFALSDNEIFKDGKIVVDNERMQKIQREEFEKQFFETSLGWVKRTVTMQDGSVKNFLTDILPLLLVGVDVLTYDSELNQKKVTVSNEFLNECKQQLIADFYGE